MKYILQNFWK